MDLVATTKKMLQSLRDEGFDVLLDYVTSLCVKHKINVPDMNAHYMDGIRSLEELHYRFNDEVMQLLRLNTSLESKNNFSLFDIEHICALTTTFYHADFGQQDMYHLKLQLDHYKIDVQLTERVFSIIKLVKNDLRNKIGEEYLRDTMLINIEREYAEEIDPDEVIDGFYAQKNRRAQLK
ncbi:uncharacterized protein LOC141673248 [Apium graveolens]|uniref:uncharacterized protein LOC141673248 n=1 Tax=Apium graveolens TaxID=4045 RepID=UPI003D7A6F19